jgi:hypothetical protein
MHRAEFPIFRGENNFKKKLKETFCTVPETI